MTIYSYPELTPDVMNSINKLSMLIQNAPDYLSNPDCPYESTQIEQLEKAFTSTVVANDQYYDQDGEVIPDIDSIDFEKESLQLFIEMRTFKNSLNLDDTTEKAAVFRLLVSLIEKMIESQERASGVKHFKKFKEIMIDSMDRYLSPIQKTEFVDNLEAFNQET